MILNVFVLGAPTTLTRTICILKDWSHFKIRFWSSEVVAPGRYKWPLKAARGKREHGNCSEKCINTGESKARLPELVTCGRGYITARGMRTMAVMSYVSIMMA